MISTETIIGLRQSYDCLSADHENVWSGSEVILMDMAKINNYLNMTKHSEL